MNFPDYIFPGAFVRLRNGSKARIYATDGSPPYVIHGRVSNGDVEIWVISGSAIAENADPNPHDIIGPWIEKPDCSKLWPLLPPWIQWLASDEDGDWCCFTVKPRVIANFWHNDGLVMLVPHKYAPTFFGDWRDSLCERPQS